MAALETEKSQASLLSDVLQSAVSDVARDQELHERDVGGALCARSTDSSMRFVEGQTVNLDLRAEAGAGGAAGLVGHVCAAAAARGKPVVTVHEDSLEADDNEARSPSESEPRWAIAVPIFAADNCPIWVLYLEGRGERRDAEQLESSVGSLLYYREVLELLLKSKAE